MHQIILAKSAKKDLDKIASNYKLRITAALFDLKEDPYLGKALKGKFKDCYSLRVWPYRIIYKIYKKDLVIFVIRIGHGQGIYE